MFCSLVMAHIYETGRTAVDKDINFNNPGVYRIELKEHLGSDWNEWFSNLTITQEKNGGSILMGMVVDQAMLHGLIRTVRDLGLTLVSIQRIETQLEKSKNGKKEK